MSNMECHLKDAGTLLWDITEKVNLQQQPKIVLDFIVLHIFFIGRVHCTVQY